MENVGPAVQKLGEILLDRIKKNGVISYTALLN
jgi:hypothetical protein